MTSLDTFCFKYLLYIRNFAQTARSPAWSKTGMTRRLSMLPPGLHTSYVRMGRLSIRTWLPRMLQKQLDG